MPVYTLARVAARLALLVRAVGARRRELGRPLLIAAALSLCTEALAVDLSGALLTDSECMQHVLYRNDDGSTPAITLPFQVNFYGRPYSQLWVNNNGNVTFDGPLWTYTPFGLVGTQAVIIAPFFADVDTRASGSDVVRYGWGQTLFEGHRAFCVNWVNVGYYSYHADKLNSFQALLVEREDGAPGDFDIVFNYGSIQWETGDASGGVNGFGGSPARVGYSNGDGRAGTSFELSGSGLPGAFLNSNTASGLIRREVGPRSRPGRLVFPVRNGQPPPDVYVAMGDSFQAGVGAALWLDYGFGLNLVTVPTSHGSYYEETKVAGEDECLRSTYAYAPRLMLGRDLRLDFVACSGATTHEVMERDSWEAERRVQTEHLAPPPGEVGQIAHLNDRTALVTLGIGGNDLGFSDVLTSCLLRSMEAVNGTESVCKSGHDELLRNRLAMLRQRSGPLNRLEEIFDTIRFKAYRAQHAVLGYPRFFTEHPTTPCVVSHLSFLELLSYADAHIGNPKISAADQIWMNDWVAKLNAEIESAAAKMGVAYVDLFKASEGHELCSGSPDQFLNEVTLDLGVLSVPPWPTLGTKALVQSFHPTRFAHEKIAAKVEETLVLPPLPELVRVVFPFQTVTTQFDVTGSTPRLAPSAVSPSPGSAPDWVSFSTRWPGSDVVMTLISPSGRVIDRSVSAPDVYHRVGETQELYVVEAPERGTWTVQLYGANVAAVGEPTTLSMRQSPRERVDPVARLSMQLLGPGLVAVDASASADSDGRIVRYLWDFGDGWTSSDVRTTHSYAAAGRYIVTLVVEDDEGLHGFADAPVVFEVDTTAPTIACPGPLYVPAALGRCSADVSVGTATATDASGVRSISGVRSDGRPLSEPYPVGATLVEWLAVDAHGNQSSCVQEISVADLEPPEFVVPASIVVPTTIPGTCAAEPLAFTIMATDNCDASPAVARSHESPYAFPWGTTTVEATASDSFGNVAWASFTATVEMIATAVASVSASPSPQQYSDPATFAASLVPEACAGAGSLNGTVSFTLDGQPLGTAPASGGTATLAGVPLLQPAPFGAAAANSVAPGAHPVSATFASTNERFLGATGTGIVSITAEDAAVTYTGALFTSTASPTSGRAAVTLAATVRDASAMEPSSDAAPGDIRNARVAFVNAETGAILCTAAVGLVDAGAPTIGTAVCSWVVDIGNAASQSFMVGIRVGGFYDRYASNDAVVVTVSRPLPSGFITGGGYLVIARSAGRLAAAAETRNNFGFNVKYNGGGTNLQGHISTIVRSAGHVYQIKGNAMTSLTSTPASGRATFSGKASIQDITDPATPISIDGNASLSVALVDARSGGTSDALAITVWNKAGGLWFASEWDGTRTLERPLGGGNLVVH